MSALCSHRSSTKFESGTGWPSFWAPASEDAVDLAGPGFLTLVFGREAKCKTCGGHLGHRFDDGPIWETGKRYCINGAALRFRAEMAASISEDASSGA